MSETPPPLPPPPQQLSPPPSVAELSNRYGEPASATVVEPGTSMKPLHLHLGDIALIFFLIVLALVVNSALVSRLHYYEIHTHHANQLIDARDRYEVCIRASDTMLQRSNELFNEMKKATADEIAIINRLKICRLGYTGVDCDDECYTMDPPPFSYIQYESNNTCGTLTCMTGYEYIPESHTCNATEAYKYSVTKQYIETLHSLIPEPNL